ncbi:hypothetical protein AND_001661 [Anopheles darlingi]|uniref:Uncharacterized protein n=1 Tax=Anopheles darlingi TaxID=43151 RepID=W5JUB7_ANODA|nr:hypothetical protein AND_001661 [Anopheles darlingi]
MSETVVLAKAATVMPTRPRSAPLERRSGLEPTAVSNGNTGSNCESVVRDLKHQQQQQPQRALMKDFVRDNSKLVKDLMALLAIREATKEEQAPARLGLLPATVADGRKNDSKCLLLPGIKGVKNRPSNDGGSGPPAALIPFTGSATRSATATAAAAVASLLHHTATNEFSSLAGEMIAIADDTNTGSLASSDNDDDGDGDEDEGPPDAGGNRDERKCTKDDGSAGNDCTELHAAANAPEPDAHNEANDERSEPSPQQQHCNRVQDYGEGKPESEVESVVHRRRSQSGSVPADGQETHLACVSVGSIERTGTPVPPVAPVSLPVPEHTGRVAQLTLEQKLDRLLDGVVKIKADMMGRIERLGHRVEQVHLDVQLNIDTTDRALLKNVLLLIGIPRLEREDLHHYFRSICLVLDYQEQDIPEVDIRRQPHHRRSSGRSGSGQETAKGEHCPRAPRPTVPPQPIMVEFKFKTIRDQFYRAYQAKRILRLSDIGIASNRRFYVNEALTKYNRMLMGEAMRRKRAGLLHSVYTADGIVYVQRVAGEKGIKVTSFAALDCQKTGTGGHG